MASNKPTDELLKQSHSHADKVIDALSGGALGAGVLALLADFNIVLQFLTLFTGLIAGVFALFFHYHRWRNERARLVQQVKQEIADDITSGDSET